MPKDVELQVGLDVPSLLRDVRRAQQELNAITAAGGERGRPQVLTQSRQAREALYSTKDVATGKQIANNEKARNKAIDQRARLLAVEEARIRSTAAVRGRPAESVRSEIENLRKTTESALAKAMGFDQLPQAMQKRLGVSLGKARNEINKEVGKNFKDLDRVSRAMTTQVMRSGLTGKEVDVVRRMSSQGLSSELGQYAQARRAEMAPHRQVGIDLARERFRALEEQRRQQKRADLAPQRIAGIETGQRRLVAFQNVKKFEESLEAAIRAHREEARKSALRAERRPTREAGIELARQRVAPRVAARQAFESLQATMGGMGAALPGDVARRQAARQAREQAAAQRREAADRAAAPRLAAEKSFRDLQASMRGATGDAVQESYGKRQAQVRAAEDRAQQSRTQRAETNRQRNQAIIDRMNRQNAINEGLRRVGQASLTPPPTSAERAMRALQAQMRQIGPGLTEDVKKYADYQAKVQDRATTRQAREQAISDGRVGRHLSDKAREKDGWSVEEAALRELTQAYRRQAEQVELATGRLAYEHQLYRASMRAAGAKMSGDSMESIAKDPALRSMYLGGRVSSKLYGAELDAEMMQRLAASPTYAVSKAFEQVSRQTIQTQMQKSLNENPDWARGAVDLSTQKLIGSAQQKEIQATDKAYIDAKTDHVVATNKSTTALYNALASDNRFIQSTVDLTKATDKRTANINRAIIADPSAVAQRADAKLSRSQLNAAVQARYDAMPEVTEMRQAAAETRRQQRSADIRARSEESWRREEEDRIYRDQMRQRARRQIAGNQGAWGRFMGALGRDGQSPVSFFGGGAAGALRYGLPSMLFYGALSGISNLIREAEELEYNLKRLEGQFKATFGPAGDFGRVKKDIIDIAKATGLGADEIANLQIQITGAFAEETLAVEGQFLTGQDLIKEQTLAAAKIAQTINLPLAEINDGMLAASLAFQRSTYDIGDVAIAIEQQSGVQAREVIKFIGDIAPVAQEAGYSLEEFSAMAAVAQQRSGRSGAALAEAFGRVIPALAGQRDALMQLAASEEALRTPEFIDALRESDVRTQFEMIGQAYNQMSQQGQQQAIELLGGRREAQSIIPVITNMGKVLELTDAASNSAGTLNKRYEDVHQTLRISLARFSENVRVMGKQILELGFVDIFKELMDGLKMTMDILGPFLSILTSINNIFAGWPARLLAVAAAMKIVTGLMAAQNAYRVQQGLMPLTPRRAAAAAFMGPMIAPSGRLAGIRDAYREGYNARRFRPDPTASRFPMYRGAQIPGSMPVMGVARNAGQMRSVMSGMRAGSAALLGGMGPVGWTIGAAALASSVYSWVTDWKNKSIEEVKEFDQKLAQEASQVDLSDVWSRRNYREQLYLEMQNVENEAVSAWTRFMNFLTGEDAKGDKLRGIRQRIDASDAYDPEVAERLESLNEAQRTELARRMSVRFHGVEFEFTDLDHRVLDWVEEEMQEKGFESLSDFFEDGPLVAQVLQIEQAQLESQLEKIFGKENVNMDLIRFAIESGGNMREHATKILEGQITSEIENAVEIASMVEAQAASLASIDADILALASRTTRAEEQESLIRDAGLLETLYNANRISYEEYARQMEENITEQRRLVSIGGKTEATKEELAKILQEEIRLREQMTSVVLRDIERNKRIQSLLSGEDSAMRGEIAAIRAALGSGQLQTSESRMDAALQIIEAQKEQEIQLAYARGGLEEVYRVFREGVRIDPSAAGILAVDSLMKDQAFADRILGIASASESVNAVIDGLYNAYSDAKSELDSSIKELTGMSEERTSAIAAGQDTKDMELEMTKVGVRIKTQREALEEALKNLQDAGLDIEDTSEDILMGMRGTNTLGRTGSKRVSIPELDVETALATIATNFANGFYFIGNVNSEMSSLRDQLVDGITAALNIQSTLTDKDAIAMAQDSIDGLLELLKAGGMIYSELPENIRQAVSYEDWKKIPDDMGLTFKEMMELHAEMEASRFQLAYQLEDAVLQTRRTRARGNRRAQIALDRLGAANLRRRASDLDKDGANELQKLAADIMREQAANMDVAAEIAEGQYLIDFATAGIEHSKTLAEHRGDTSGALRDALRIAQQNLRSAQFMNDDLAIQQALTSIAEAEHAIFEYQVERQQRIYEGFISVLSARGDNLKAAELGVQKANWQRWFAQGDDIFDAMEAQELALIELAEAQIQAREEALEDLNVRTLDPLTQARNTEQALRDQLAIARAAGLTGQIRTLQNQLVEAERATSEAMFDVRMSMHDLRIAELNAMEDSIGAAQVQEQMARQQLNQLIAQNAGQAAINRGRAEVINAEQAARDAVFHERMDEYQWLLDMGDISKSQHINYLEGLKSLLVPGTKKFRDLELTLKRLRDDIGSDMQANLPTSLALPTLYDVRRLSQVGPQGAPEGPQIGYQDNRQISITVNAANMSEDQILTTLHEAIGNNRSGSAPRRY